MTSPLSTRRRFVRPHLLRLAVAVGVVLAAGSGPEAQDRPDGAAIYKMRCAGCHGDNGQGVAEVNDQPLEGNRSLAELVRIIDETMPEDDPDACTGEDATRVARHIFETFYSAAARARRKPARIELAHLTVRQYLHTLADLLSDDKSVPEIGAERGLQGEYYNSRRFRRSKRVEERIDPRVAFDFGSDSPHPKIEDPEEFSIRWEGAVLAEETGDYEFIVKTANGMRLWVNGEEKPLIDAWVSSSGGTGEHTATIRLLGGRLYPVRLDMFKYKDESASISLEWKPPHKSRQVIPRRNLSPQRVPETFVATTAFPPDDRVSGYERGTAVSAAWEQATTEAAVEAAAAVIARIDADGSSDDRRERALQYCRRLAERAFRRPLSEGQRRFFVDAHFESAEDVDSAVKRSVILILKSPRFLYPPLKRGRDSFVRSTLRAVPAKDSRPLSFDDYDAAARLALRLWDSLPDGELLQAASRGELRTAEQIGRQASRMLEDPRAGAKLRHALHEWLQLDEKEEIIKDEKLFPGFDEALASDLRTSLDLFLDDVLRSEGSDYRQLVLADYVFLNERLARFYGVDAEAEKSGISEKAGLLEGGFEKVSFEPGRRAGVVTHPYLLSMLAYHNLSSPIHRGVFVTRRLLGRTLEPPPQATEFKDGEFAPDMTTREKVAILTKPAACRTCHDVINPLGFSLEHFDAVGRYRERDSGKPIDASSPFTTVAGETVRLEGARSLAEFIAGSENAHGAFVDHLFHQTVKQPINAYGPTARRDLIREFQSADFNIRKLLVEIMKVSIAYEREHHSRKANRVAEKP